MLSLHSIPESTGAATFADLIGRYSENGRYYHNLTHLHEVLAVVDELVDGGNDATAIRFAGWFHDAVYDSRAKDNEERSAQLAKALLIGFGLPQPLVTNVVRLILLTKTHRTDENDRDGHVLLDADLAILGTDDGCYDHYASAIRREYSSVAEDAYRAGRSRVLEGFLARPRIYFTEKMLRSHEDRARRNLQRELELLARSA
jgi:predicted metal-dependent HD superfamily phosphohydrolase